MNNYKDNSNYALGFTPTQITKALKGLTRPRYDKDGRLVDYHDEKTNRNDEDYPVSKFRNINTIFSNEFDVGKKIDERCVVVEEPGKATYIMNSPRQTK